MGLATGLGWLAQAKLASGEGDDDDNADVGDGADHVDNGDVFTTEYLAHVCLSPQYHDDNGYDGVAFDIDGHHDNCRFVAVIVDLSVVLPASLVLPLGLSFQ